jgi:hypothetical protein
MFSVSLHVSSIWSDVHLQKCLHMYETIARTTTTLCSLGVRCLNIKVSSVITIYNGINLNASINNHLNYWCHYWLCNNNANDIAAIVLHLYMKSSHQNCKVSSIQHYVMKFVSDLRQVGGFRRLSTPIKLTAMI